MSGQLDPIQLMRKIAELENKIDALRTIEVGGVWQDWTPTPTASGSMTFTITDTIFCQYATIGKLCFISTNIVGTTGGTASSSIRLSLPIAPVDYGSTYVSISSGINDGGYVASESYINTQESRIEFFKATFGNFGIGTGKMVIANGFYRIA